MNELMGQLKRRWFLVALVTVILLAKGYPYLGSKDGPLHPKITVKYIAVFAIFFSSGLSLKTEELTRALGQVRLHLFIQIYTLIIIPIIMTIIVKFLTLGKFIDTPFLQGLHVVGCMPPPVSSAVILTKAVGGNEAAAIFNSALGSFLGIIFTPILLLNLVGTTATIPFRVIILQLSMTVLAPLLLGQMLRKLFKKKLQEIDPPFGTISSCILLLIIYTTFCDTFSNSKHNISTRSVTQVAIVIVSCQCLFLTLAYALMMILDTFSRKDIVAVLFCSTHKSLTLGIPIIKIIFGRSPDMSYTTLPLLIYHPTQIILGSILVSWLQSWVNNNGSANSADSGERSPSPEVLSPDSKLPINNPIDVA